MREVSAYEELSSTGEVGAAMVELLRQLAAQVARTSSFPPPEGYASWSNPAIDDLLADLFEKKGKAFVLACFAKATDQGSFERLLLATIRNHLIDEAKGTERGKLRRRMAGLLGEDPRFRRVAAADVGTACWALANGEQQPWQGDITQLEVAAAHVRGVAVHRWNTSGPTPTGTKHALLTVAEAVLNAANRCVADQDLARVIESRFDLIGVPLFTALETHDGLVAEPPDASEGPEALVTNEAYAQQLWAALTATERAALPHLGSPKDLSEALEIGLSRARTVENKLIAKIRMATVDDDDAQNVVLALHDLAEADP